MDTLPFYFLLFIHLVSLVIGFGAVVVVDVFGLLWVLGKAKLALVTRVAEVTQRLIWAGWCGLVLSGVPMLMLKGYIDGLTVIKLFLVLLLGFNGILLHFVKRSLQHSGGHPAPLLQFRIAFCSLISQTGWWGAIIIGFLHRHWQHNIAWPDNPEAYIAGIILFFMVVGGVGELFFRNLRPH